MRKQAVALAMAGATAVAIGAAVTTSNAPDPATASSHREAPLIANDPTADITDFYMFRSPDGSDSVTLAMNVIPFEAPPEGPNYYNLDDSARYGLHVDQDGNGKPEISWYLRTKTEVRNGNTFLYATGPVTSLHDPDLNVTQTWTLWERRGKDGHGHLRKVGTGTTAPNYVGNGVFGDSAGYNAVASSAVRTLGGGVKAFVGPREDPFFIDVGRIFDLLSVGGKGTDNVSGFNVHTIALQVPLGKIRPSASDPVIGAYTTVDRMHTSWHKVGKGKRARWVEHSAWKQVERLGQPLVNEVLIPLKDKDRWNTLPPSRDAQFEKYYTAPGLVGALNGIVLGNALGVPAELQAQTTGRADLSAILLRGFRYPATGTPVLDLTMEHDDPVDLLRLNTSIAPTMPIAEQDRRGILNAFSTAPPAGGAQLDGYPNGRRPGDDVTDIQIAALLGLPVDDLIPESIQRPYALGALGEADAAAVAAAFPQLPNLAALAAGADGVLRNDRAFSDAFPFLASPFAGNPVGSS
jgi:hypothetical protein